MSTSTFSTSGVLEGHPITIALSCEAFPTKSVNTSSKMLWYIDVLESLVTGVGSYV